MKLSFLLFAVFSASMLAALFVGSNLIAQEVSIVEDSADVANSAYFFFYILLATAVLLVVLKFYRGRKLFVLMEAALVFFTVDTRTLTKMMKKRLRRKVKNLSELFSRKTGRGC